MKARSIFAALTIMFIISSRSLHGTTCIAGKTFKVSQTCGTVTDKDGAVIPDAKIQVTPKDHPEGAKEIVSDQEGKFALQNASDGQYEIRVKYPGFSDAWQPFRVTGLHGSAKCGKPIHVVMVLAGGCSYVENAWKKSELKK